MTPFRTDRIDNAPITGQQIHCTVCDVSMPSYSIAHTHFNSPKHNKKVLLNYKYFYPFLNVYDFSTYLTREYNDRENF